MFRHYALCLLAFPALLLEGQMTPLWQAGSEFLLMDEDTNV